MKTYAPKPADIERRWYVVDADGAVLGRLASEVARILRGKDKPIYAPHADTGDHVVVINARGVRLTGGKQDKKIAYRHSGYPGGLTATVYSRLMEERPAFAVEKAVRGMLPKTRLGRSMGKKLSVYEGADHPHEAQKPQPLKLGEVPKWNGLPVPVEALKQPAKPRAAAKKPAASAENSATASAPVKPKTPAKKAATAKKTMTKTAAVAKKTTAKRSTAKKTTAKRTAAKPSAKDKK
jgi:large subunit ribosomal protein L13